MNAFVKRAVFAATTVLFFNASAYAQEAPAPGASARVDAIRAAGKLRVAVLANPPWLSENTSGQGDTWGGPAWALSMEVAKLLGVEVEPVPVSHETKVPVLAADQVDLTITPLAETPERLKVIDFVIYSNTSVCLFGLESNAKFMAAKSVDDLNVEGMTIAYFLGSSEEGWVKTRFPNATLRGVTGTGPAPVEQVMSKRADSVPINRIQWVALQQKVKGLSVLPSASNCQDSQEKAAPVGIGIDQDQEVFRTWLRAVVARIQTQLRDIELEGATKM